MANNNQTLADFLAGKSNESVELFNHFIEEYKTVGLIEIHGAKTMIGISNEHKRIAWVTQFGKKFLHVVFPFRQPYHDNFCFTKIAQVPDDNKQFNHHFRMMYIEDINEEVKRFMRLAYYEENNAN